jgi:hypothetical protein
LAAERILTLLRSSIKHLASADYIIALADGTICEHGKYEDLLVNEGYVFSLRGKLYISGHSETKRNQRKKG